MLWGLITPSFSGQVILTYKIWGVIPGSSIWLEELSRFHFFWRLQTGCLKSPKKIDNSSSQMLLLGVIPHMLYVSFICYLSCRWCDVCCVEQFLAMFCLLIYFEEGDTVPQSRQRRVSCQLTNGCTFHSINSFLPVSYISPFFAFATFFSFLCVLCQYFYNVCNVPQSRRTGAAQGGSRAGAAFAKLAD